MTAIASASRTPLYLTFALMLFGFSSINTARVSFSLIALELGASPSTVGLLVGTFYVFPVVLSWPVGRYCDRVGSLRLLLLGSGFGLSAMLVPYFVREPAALFVGAALMGIAFTLYNVLLPNLVGLLSPPQERVRNFSNSSLVGGFSLVIGPLMAGFAVDFAPRGTATLWLAALSVVVGALLLLWGRTLPGGAALPASAAASANPLADREMVRILATSSLVQVGQDLFQFYIPVHGVANGISASAIGAVLATFAVASFVVRLVMPSLVARLGDERVLVYSFYCAALGFILVPFFANPAALAVCSFLFGLGIGCGQPITTLLIFSRSPPGRSGETFGLRQTVNNALRVAAPPLFGLVATAFGLPPVFYLSAALMGGGGWIARSKSAPKEGR